MTDTLRFDELPALLRAEIERRPAGTVALLAGHFTIFSSGGEAADRLDVPLLPSGAPEALLAFSRRTFEVGCEVAASTATHDPRLMVLVDDVLGLRPTIADRSTAERLSAALAQRYLSQHPTLPSFHARVLARAGLDERSVLRRSDDRWMFSERECRGALVTHVHRELRSSETHAAGLCESADGATITVSHPEHGAYCLVHAGNTNCAGGYVEVIAEAHRRGVRTLLAMIPMRCAAPVHAGTALARSLYALEQLQVVNIAIGDVNDEALVHISRG